MNSNKDQMTPRAGGLGLGSKLSLGFIALLAILLAVGVESIELLDRLGGSIDVILRENYKSVVACERMKESLERMDSGALFALAGEEARGRALAAEHRPRFEEALQTELGNITLPGEGERARRLRQLFSAFVPVLDRVLDPAIPVAERRSLYFGRLLPTFQQIKATAGEILEMNQQNMVEANDRAREMAAAAGRRMAVMLLLGTALAGICIAFLLRSILAPLERLTQALRRVEKGDLDLSVPVTSRDELGQLASAFNSMAARLRALRHSEQARRVEAYRLSQHVIDGLPEAVVALSMDRQVTLANRPAESLLGLRPGEPLPEAHARWIAPLLDRAERDPGITERGIAEPHRLPVEGGERFLLPRISVLRDDDDRSTGMILILTDVTDQLRSGEITRDLLANASRDLDAALAPVRSGLQVLQELLGRLTPEQRDLLIAAQEGAGRIRQVAENLHGAARLEAGRRELHAVPVSPRELIEAAVHPLQEMSRDRGVALNIEVDPAAPRVLADRERAGLLLASLLHNAIAHTPAGGSITVRAEPREGRSRFAVTDSGEGIPSADAERVFEPFYQVPGTEELGGAGLGLTIARDIVQTHGGEIHCESEKGHGATFWFTLPAAVILLLLLLIPGVAAAQEFPIATDRPGFLFSSLTVDRGAAQLELGLPSVTLIESGDSDFRTTSFVALLRYGVAGAFELRLGAPVYTDTETGSGYGDLEVGAKWHLLANKGGRPSLALIPSVILPAGEDGFTAGDPVYQLIAALEWTLADGWGLAGLAGVLNGPSGDDRFTQETFALSLGRSLPSPAWSAYGEVAYVTTDIEGASDASFAGGGLKYLTNNDVQLDLSFDRGLTDDSPDWLFGLGLAARF